MPPESKRTYECTVPFCTTKKSSGFHCLPRNVEIRNAWFEKLQLDPKIKNHRVCDLHFDDSVLGKGHVKSKLFKDAIPSKNLPVRIKIIFHNFQTPKCTAFYIQVVRTQPVTTIRKTRQIDLIR